jgi:hypothetical protein
MEKVNLVYGFKTLLTLRNKKKVFPMLKIEVRPIKREDGTYQAPFAIIGITGTVITEFWKRADASEFIEEYMKIEAKYI